MKMRMRKFTNLSTTVKTNHDGLYTTATRAHFARSFCHRASIQATPSALGCGDCTTVTFAIFCHIEFWWRYSA